MSEEFTTLPKLPTWRHRTLGILALPRYLFSLFSVRIPRLEGEVESLSGLHKQKFVLQRENQALKTNISGLEKQLVSFGERHDYPRKRAPLIWWEPRLSSKPSPILKFPLLSFLFTTFWRTWCSTNCFNPESVTFGLSGHRGTFVRNKSEKF